ncbi:oligosaccharide flippase family protein [Tsuneonella amylolytica]|uniref:oligosaccharide flippase family protein n=1 Tax=Tsuneonella amylolytica TaxID=2338327 RepID=UPI0013C4BC0D|nr:oligosaccharide flippase family protein [Tsuneonella amylolytica]
MTAWRVGGGIAKVASTVRARGTLFAQIGWVGGSFVAQQVVRLATNVALAWLLAPALLGTMLLINTLRTGGELLSDVGIGQSMVHNQRAEERAFFDTAWTLKIVRGLVLFVIALALTVPLAALYDDPQLRVLLPISALIFVISGFASPSRYLLQKRLEVRRIALFDLAVSVASLVIHIVFALLSPTIWALVGGLLLGTLVSTVGSYFLLRGVTHRLKIERHALREITHFGKWIFFASLVYFLAMNFDRLYFADAIPFAVLGIYGIARTFADTVLQVFQRMGNMLIFPKISASEERGFALRARIAPLRWPVLIGSAAALALAVTFADTFIDLAYDDRYSSAGIFLTILLVGTWFAILGALADAMVMGVGKPASVATSNIVKLAVIAGTLPMFLPRWGIIAALFGFVAGEAARYAVLVWRKHALGLAFFRQDLAATMLFLVFALFCREFSGLLGLTSGLAGWVAQAGTAHV